MKAPVKVLTVGLSLLTSLILSTALGQSVGVKDIPANADTTIRIEKGVRTDQQFEVITNKEEIEGESANLLKEARTNWNTACKEWKNETRELHKENQIVALNCGKRICNTASMETTCTSEATSKIKVRVK